MWVRHIIGGGRSSSLTSAPWREKFTCFHLHKKWMPRSTLRGCPGTSNDWTGAVIRFSSHGKMTNEIQIYFSITSHTKTKNEIQIRFSKWCENEKRNSNPFFKVMRERKTKFKSVFKVMRKWKTKLKRNSLPFFKVVRKRKTKYEVPIRFSMSCEKEKWKWNLNSIFPCHRKTVGNKVHKFSICNPFQINYLFFSHTNGV